MHKKILVTGATGMLGSILVPHLLTRFSNVISHGRSLGAEIVGDMTKMGDALEVLSKTTPDIVVNLIGLTSVEECESDLHKAYLVNVRTVENIVSACKILGLATYLIHISTDHVYDGSGVSASLESDIIIRNNYAMTKYAGELIALGMSSAILRTNFVGKSKVAGRESLTDWVFESCTKNIPVSVLNDVLFNPLSMVTLSEVICSVIEQKPLGVFNAGSRGGMSKAEFDFKFARMLSLPVEGMKGIKSSDANFLKARRPKNMLMNVHGLETVLGFEFPALESEILRVSKEYAK